LRGKTWLTDFPDQHQSEGSGGTVSVKEQKLQQLAKNPLLLSLQPPPQQQQVRFKYTPLTPLTYFSGPRQRNLQISIPSIKWTGVLAPAAAGMCPSTPFLTPFNLFEGNLEL
jgi:hypothetical protein